MKDLILYFWQLPQNLLGLLVILFSKAKKDKLHDIYVTEMYFGVSLGAYVILGKRGLREIDIKHEKGHQKQSKYLGWFYLVIIGLPSLIGNLIDRVHPLDYYNLPWEKWADKLGGVKR